MRGFLRCRGRQMEPYSLFGQRKAEDIAADEPNGTTDPQDTDLLLGCLLVYA